MEAPYPQTVVCQIGARRHYAVPVALHQAGMLERLYTDYCMSDPVLRGLKRVTPTRFAKGRLERLFGREIPEVPADRITCLWRSMPRKIWSALRSRRQQSDAYAVYCKKNAAFGTAVVRGGFGNADAVYGFNGAAVEIFEAARSQGRLRVLDQTIAPLRSMAALLEEERQRWPDWDLESADPSESVKRMIDREQAEWEQADRILCGSEFVADALSDEGVPADRIQVIRWGNQLATGEVTRDPWEGRALRVLVAGTVELRKGVPYVVEAAKLLPNERFEFRSVGSVRLSRTALAQVQEFVDVKGAVTRVEMPSHYAWADVLLHPSLAEGSANVCHEAMASGLPVITTPNAGSAVVDGESGFIVPIRCAESIASRLAVLADDADLWQRMSEQAREASVKVSPATYQRHLSSVLRAASSSRESGALQPVLQHTTSCP